MLALGTGQRGNDKTRAGSPQTARRPGSGRQRRPQPASRDKHAWRQFMNRGAVPLVARHLTVRVSVRANPALGGWVTGITGDHSRPAGMAQELQPEDPRKLGPYWLLGRLGGG